MRKWFKSFREEGKRGQSLVETALFLPILIFILAGIVEVSNLLITQNRVTTSARTAAGFGASNYSTEPLAWDSGSPENGGLAYSMGIVALNTVTQTMDLSEDLWDIWSIHARTNTTGSDFDEFVATRASGVGGVVTNDEWTNTLESQVRNSILTDLQSTGNESAENLEIVASVVYHNADTLLGIPLWQWTGLQRIRGLTVMRVDGPAPVIGCTLMPITVRVDQVSAYPTGWPDGVAYPGSVPAIDSGDDQNIFPAGTSQNWDNPVPPVYLNQKTPPNLLSNEYPQNIPGIPFSQAKPGYLYFAREATSSGGFGWLTWDGATSQQALEDSISWLPLPPGNFLEKYPNSPADMNQISSPGDIDYPAGDADGELEEFEWLQVSTGNIAAVTSLLLQDYVNASRPVTVIYYDKWNDLGGGNANVRVRGFVTVKIIGINFTGQDKHMAFEFVRWSTECILDTP